MHRLAQAEVGRGCVLTVTASVDALKLMKHILARLTAVVNEDAKAKLIEIVLCSWPS